MTSYTWSLDIISANESIDSNCSMVVIPIGWIKQQHYASDSSDLATQFCARLTLDIDGGYSGTETCDSDEFCFNYEPDNKDKDLSLFIA